MSVVSLSIVATIHCAHASMHGDGLSLLPPLMVYDIKLLNNMIIHTRGYTRAIQSLNVIKMTVIHNHTVRPVHGLRQSLSLFFYLDVSADIQLVELCVFMRTSILQSVRGSLCQHWIM